MWKKIIWNGTAIYFCFECKVIQMPIFTISITVNTFAIKLVGANERWRWTLNKYMEDRMNALISNVDFHSLFIVHCSNATRADWKFLWQSDIRYLKITSTQSDWLKIKRLTDGVLLPLHLSFNWQVFGKHFCDLCTWIRDRARHWEKELLANEVIGNGESTWAENRVQTNKQIADYMADGGWWMVNGG